MKCKQTLNLHAKISRKIRTFEIWFGSWCYSAVILFVELFDTKAKQFIHFLLDSSQTCMKSWRLALSNISYVLFVSFMILRGEFSLWRHLTVYFFAIETLWPEFYIRLTNRISALNNMKKLKLIKKRNCYYSSLKEKSSFLKVS